jgi:SAM-dependent methyltransferase
VAPFGNGLSEELRIISQDQAPPTLDDVRTYWDRRPCNIRHSVKDVGTRDYFDEVEARKYFVEPHIPDFAQFERWRDKKVLEIGCGIGTDSINFVRAGAKLTAVDISEKSLELCRKRFELYGLEADIRNADAERLSDVVVPQTYDLIYSFGVIHHTPHPERVFAELKKFCGPETELRIMLYSKWSWKVLAIILGYGKGAFWRRDELVRTYSEAQTGCPVTFHYTFDEVRRLMGDYQVVSIEKEHIFPFVIDKYVKYQYEREWYFRALPTQVFRWLEKVLGWHTLVVARPKEWAAAR